MANLGKIVPMREEQEIKLPEHGRRHAIQMVAFSDRVAVPTHVLVRHLDEETVLLNLETEKYFGLDATGTRMWELSIHSPSIEAACGKLSDEFEVEPELLRRHLCELLSQLVENGLLRVLPADVETIPAI